MSIRKLHLKLMYPDPREEMRARPLLDSLYHRLQTLLVHIRVNEPQVTQLGSCM